MLRAEPYDQLVAARLLDFFGAETAWQRRLWDVGTCLTLRELVEACDAVVGRALTSEAVDWLRNSALTLAGRDVGVGTAAERSTLTAALKGKVAQGTFDARIIERLAETASQNYLHRWAAALDAGPPPIGAERLARAVAGHLLGIGFSPDYLHRWWSYRIKHEPGTRTLSDLMRDAHDRAGDPLFGHTVIVPLRRATGRAQELPGWLPADQASALLTPINKKPIAALAGAISLSVMARDPGAAVEAAADLVDRYVARITLGGGHEGLDPLPYVWVTAGGPHSRMRLRTRRGLEIPVLLRRDEPITTPVAPRIDASLELLGPVDHGPTASAVAGGWAAVETLLSAPGDRAKVHAADRLATLIACSFPRAELTRLAYRFFEHESATDPALAQALSEAATNTAAAGRLARHLVTTQPVFTDPSDAAAAVRARALVLNPNAVLRDIEDHLRRTLRRLYRVRNLVLHNAATDCLTLVPALRAAAPLLGAGIDRVVRGVLLQGLEPLDLAARGRIVIDNADNLDHGDLADLLQLADQ